MEQHIELEGRVVTVLAGTMFRVELDNKHQVLATISGKMRKRFIRLTAGGSMRARAVEQLRSTGPAYLGYGVVAFLMVVLWEPARIYTMLQFLWPQSRSA